MIEAVSLFALLGRLRAAQVGFGADSSSAGRWGEPRRCLHKFQTLLKPPRHYVNVVPSFGAKFPHKPNLVPPRIAGLRTGSNGRSTGASSSACCDQAARSHRQAGFLETAGSLHRYASYPYSLKFGSPASRRIRWHTFRTLDSSIAWPASFGKSHSGSAQPCTSRKGSGLDFHSSGA